MPVKTANPQRVRAARQNLPEVSLPDGDDLATLRHAAHLTQAEAGDLVGVSESAISKWERETRHPPLDTLHDLVDRYQTRIDESGGHLNDE